MAKNNPLEVLVFDNYDSFTYNLVHLLEDLGAQLTVVRNDEADWEAIDRFQRIVLSPGPGLPADAGLLLPLLQQGNQKKILGVCLGMQAMVEAAGGQLTNLSRVRHGVSTPIQVLDQDPLFVGLPNQIEVGRYHSWAVRQADLPADFVVTALDEEGYVMAIRHQRYPWTGVQFHPESVMTPDGRALLNNWLEKA